MEKQKLLLSRTNRKTVVRNLCETKMFCLINTYLVALYRSVSRVELYPYIHMHVRMYVYTI